MLARRNSKEKMEVDETEPLKSPVKQDDGLVDHPHYGRSAKVSHTKHTMRAEEVYMKGTLAFIFAGVSVFTCFYAWDDVKENYGYETTWKQFMFWLSVVLTMPSIYQTTLMLFVFIAVWRDNVEEECAIRRPIWLVIVYGLALTLVIPVFLPIALVLGPLACLCGLFEWEKMCLLLVALIDFLQTMVLIPLAYVVVFSANETVDVFLKTVVVQVYATMDDEFVKAFLEGPNVKQEALDMYCDHVEVLETGAVRHAKPVGRVASLKDFAY